MATTTRAPLSLHSSSARLISSSSDSQSTTPPASEVPPVLPAEAGMLIEKDEAYVSHLLSMEIPENLMPAYPKLKSRSNLPKDRTVPAKVAAIREKGKLTPTQLIQFFTSYQRDKTTTEDLARLFDVEDSGPLLEHYAVPLIYQEVVTKEIFGAYEVPSGVDLTAPPKYLGEHLNQLAAQKQEIEKRRTVDESKNFNFS